MVQIPEKTVRPHALCQGVRRRIQHLCFDDSRYIHTMARVFSSSCCLNHVLCLVIPPVLCVIGLSFVCGQGPRCFSKEGAPRMSSMGRSQKTVKTDTINQVQLGIMIDSVARRNV